MLSVAAAVVVMVAVAAAVHQATTAPRSTTAQPAGEKGVQGGD